MIRIYTGTSLSFQHKGKFHTVDDTHPRFDEMVQLTDVDDMDAAAALVDVKAVVETLVAGSDVSLQGNQLIYKGNPVRGLLGERIIDMANQGLNVDSLVCLLENLSENPSSRAVEELYGFLEVSKLPITDDGHFLAYKSVKQDFTDHHSGTMDNSVGSVVSMERNLVNEDKDQTCSYGLHFAAHEYAQGFGRGGRMVVLKINPRDVVSIPSDYNNQKGRCCKYEVVEEVARDDDGLVGRSVVAAKPVYVPQSDNYDDMSIWANDFWGEGKDFIGYSSQFPVNRDTIYTMYRDSTDTGYVNVRFTNYDVEHDNLIFTYGPESNRDFCTVSDLSDWDITTGSIFEDAD